MFVATGRECSRSPAARNLLISYGARFPCRPYCDKHYAPSRAISIYHGESFVSVYVRYV